MKNFLVYIVYAGVELQKLLTEVLTIESFKSMAGGRRPVFRMVMSMKI